MVKVIIVEDEERSRDVLKEMLRSHFNNVEVIAACKNVEEGIQAIEKHGPDLIFLDVELEEKTGFDLLQQLHQVSFDIIFTTGYEKYAIQAIKSSALDFLLKPFSLSDVSEALKRYEKKIEKQQRPEQLETLFHNLRHLNAEAKKIALPTLNGLMIIAVKDIIRCESDVNYTTFHLLNKQRVVVAKNLKEFEEMLCNYDFIRIHNSHLINLHHISTYTRGEGGSVTMVDGTHVDVSRRKKIEFLKKLAEL